jgi:hypothetical protein
MDVNIVRDVGLLRILRKAIRAERARRDTAKKARRRGTKENA